MKWDTEAFRTMGLVHIYIYIYIRTYVDAKHLGLAELQGNRGRHLEPIEGMDADQFRLVGCAPHRTADARSSGS